MPGLRSLADPWGFGVLESKDGGCRRCGVTWRGGEDGFALPGGGEAPWGRGAGATSWLHRQLGCPGRAVPDTGGHGTEVLHGHGQPGPPAMGMPPSQPSPSLGSAAEPDPPAAGGSCGERAETRPLAAPATLPSARSPVGVSVASAHACRCCARRFGEIPRKTRLGPKAAARKPSRTPAAAAEAPRLCRGCVPRTSPCY